MTANDELGRILCLL